ncbi:MAG: sulfite exporter TauE/SafE family protein [Alphaproteobacteria bacterium]
MIEFLESVNPLYSLSGFVVGVLVGMTGVGGGALMTPLLILLFGVHPATAVGTDLLYAAATKSGGTAVHGWARTINWRVVGRLAAGSVPMTALTLLVLAQLGIHGAAANKLITVVLGGALLATATVLILRKSIVAYYGEHVGKLDARRTRWLTIATGAVLGVLVSISSVGAGALGVTALILLYPHLPIVRIVGSDIAHAVPLTLVAGTGHWWLGSVDWMLFGSLLVGSLPGIVLGSLASVRMPEIVLRVTLAGVLIIVVARLWF